MHATGVKHGRPRVGDPEDRGLGVAAEECEVRPCPDAEVVIESVPLLVTILDEVAVAVRVVCHIVLPS